MDSESQVVRVIANDKQYYCASFTIQRKTFHSKSVYYTDYETFVGLKTEFITYHSESAFDVRYREGQ